MIVIVPLRVALGFATTILMSSLAIEACAQDASPWQRDGHSAVRLLAGSRSGAVLLGGIAFQLQPGWKTYWRTPGDSGVPPRFDFSKSENIEAVTVLWPAPTKFDDGAGGPPHVLPPVEMVAKSGLFDYTAAYTQGATEYYCPARLSPEVEAEVVLLAGECHTLLGCRDVSRADMVVDAEGRAFVLEVNTSPGLTETSLLPMAAEVAGLSFQQLVESLARAALDRVE